MVKIPLDRPIFPDDEWGETIGFTSDKFSGESYLWAKSDKSIFISFIMSTQEGKGNMRALINNLLCLGLTVKVPTPFPRMECILKRMGFEKIIENDENMGPVEIMKKDHP